MPLTSALAQPSAFGSADVPDLRVAVHPATRRRVRPKGPMMSIEEFSYARGRARVPVKITMPSPLVMYGAWSAARDSSALSHLRSVIEALRDSAEE